MAEPGTLELLTTRDVAAWLRIDRSTIYRLVSERKIPAIRVGADYRFVRSQLEQWMKEGEVKPCA